VIGPIGDPDTDVRRHADWLFQGIIKPVFAEHFGNEFDVPERADDIAEPGSINTQVITRLLDVPLVIADLSLHNANAFYELAIRHMKRLPTIHMIHKDWKLPFDLAAFRAISFSLADYLDLENARVSLKSTVEEVIKPGFVVENPITHARGVIEVSEHASPEQRVILDKLGALERQIQELDRRSTLQLGAWAMPAPTGTITNRLLASVPPQAGSSPTFTEFKSPPFDSLTKGSE
jgi:hypothetical protein